MQKNEKVGIIGLGRIGRCLVNGLIEAGGIKNIFYTTRHDKTALLVKEELGIVNCRSNKELIKASDVVVIAVKPQNIGTVLDEIKEELEIRQTVISIVASVPLSKICERIGKEMPILRAMPNTPIFVREGMTVICQNKFATERDFKRAEMIFKPLGKLVSIDERLMNAATALSGCGPAYIYVILEALTEAGIKVGLSRDLAALLSSQTVLGSAKMLQQTKKHPAELKDEVTTPAGCTIDGLMALEDGKLRSTLIKAVVKAEKRAKVLAKKAKM